MDDDIETRRAREAREQLRERLAERHALDAARFFRHTQPMSDSGYRTDETAELRRRVEELELKLDTADMEERHLKGQLTAAQRVAADRGAERDTLRADNAALSKRLSEVRSGVEEHSWRRAVAGAASFALVGSGIISAAALVLFVLGAMIASCHGRSPSPANETGVITDRYHYRQSSYTTCSGSGTSRRCTTHTIPEHWSVRVAHDGHERDVRLDEDDWTATRIGAPWCEFPPCAPLEVTEER